VDYSGIEIGTPILQKTLDDHHLPITWFVETSWKTERNIPSLFPELIKEISERQQDDMGLHIHWSKEGVWGEAYETKDPEWITCRLLHGVKELEQHGIRPRFFRSGSFLRVTDLAGKLAEAGFEADSSTRFGLGNPYRDGHGRKNLLNDTVHKVVLAKKALSGNWSFYRTGRGSVEEKGNSSLLEFPVTFNVFDLMNPWKSAFLLWLLSRSCYEKKDVFLTLFFHIDEFLSPSKGDQPSLVSSEKEAFFNEFLDKWVSSRSVKFISMGEALLIARNIQFF
jgi:hypothetical protein